MVKSALLILTLSGGRSQNACQAVTRFGNIGARAKQMPAASLGKLFRKRLVTPKNTNNDNFWPETGIIMTEQTFFSAKVQANMAKALKLADCAKPAQSN